MKINAETEGISNKVWEASLLEALTELRKAESLLNVQMTLTIKDSHQVYVNSSAPKTTSVSGVPRWTPLICETCHEYHYPGQPCHHLKEKP